MEKILEFSAEIKRKIFWSKREIIIKEKTLTYFKRGSSRKRNYNIEKIKFSLSVNYKKRGEFIFCFYEKIENPLFYMKIDRYSVFDNIVNFFKNKNLWIKEKNDEILEDINLRNIDIIKENDKSQEPKMEGRNRLVRKNTQIEIVNNKENDKNDIIEKINEFRETTKKKRILFQIEKNETFYFLVNNKLIRQFFKVLFKIFNYVKFLMNINSFKYMSNSIMIAYFIQLFTSNNYAVLFFTFLILFCLIYWVFHFKFYVKRYLITNFLKPNLIDNFRIEAIELIKDIIYRNIHFFFHSIDKNKVIEVTQNKNTKNQISTNEIFFIRFNAEEIQNFIKIKSSLYSFSITFYGNFDIENYNKLCLMIFKIENMLKNLSENINNESREQNNSSNESKLYDNIIERDNKIFSSEKKKDQILLRNKKMLFSEQNKELSENQKKNHSQKLLINSFIDNSKNTNFTSENSGNNLVKLIQENREINSINANNELTDAENKNIGLENNDVKKEGSHNNEMINETDSLDFSNPPTSLNNQEQIDLYSSEEYISFIFKKKLAEYKLDLESKWNLESFKEGEYKIEKKSHNIFVMRRCSVKIRTSIQKIIEILKNCTLTQKYNDLVSYICPKKNFNENCYLGHLVVKCPFPVSDRDFLDYYIYKKVSETKHIFLVTEANDVLFSKKKKYIRGSNSYSIYELEVISENEVQLVLTTKSDSKMKFLPKSIIEMCAKRVGKIAVNLKAYAENNQ